MGSRPSSSAGDTDVPLGVDATAVVPSGIVDGTDTAKDEPPELAALRARNAALRASVVEQRAIIALLKAKAADAAEAKLTFC